MEIEIKKLVTPDVVVTESIKESYGNRIEYTKYSFSFSEGIAFKQEVDEEGKPRYSYRDGKYIACKLIDDDVYIVDSSFGWRKHELATIHWHEILVEKELLDEATNKSTGQK